MKILYISSLVSDSLFEDFYRKGLTNGFVGQKYHGLFAKGLAASSDYCQVTVLSQPPINKSYYKLSDNIDGIHFRYVPIINIPILKQLIYFLYTFCFTVYWCLVNIKHEKVVLSSLMRIYQYFSVWLPAYFFHCKQVTVACDVPWMTTVQVATVNLSIKQRFSIWLGKVMCGIFDGYVPNLLEAKENKRVIIYAGGLNIKYGIANLIEAVKSLNDDSVELWLYGSGDMDILLKKEIAPCVKYLGPRSNQEVVAAELKAEILINPRPTTDEYTRYSFPSKTLEYMASGTYTMTTRLAGIPKEYFNYCGVIEDYSVEGIAMALRETLKSSTAELYEKGKMAKQFVLENKNNKKLTKQVIDFIHGIK